MAVESEAPGVVRNTGVGALLIAVVVAAEATPEVVMMSCHEVTVPLPPSEDSSRVYSFQFPLGVVSALKIEAKVAVPTGAACGHALVHPAQPFPASAGKLW